MNEQNQRNSMEKRAVRAAKSYRELARVFSFYITEKEITKETTEKKMIRHCSERCCQSCPGQKLCCVEQKEQWEKAFLELAQYSEKNGAVTLEELPRFFKETCFLPEEIESEWNRELFFEKTKQRAFRQMMESKSALVRQLEETAGYLQRLSEAEGQEERLPAEQERALQQWLRQYHVRVSDITRKSFPRRGTQWTMTLRCDSRRKISVRLVERLLSERLGGNVREQTLISRMLSEEPLTMIFAEEPGYTAITGVARSVKREQQVSGDSFSFFYETDGAVSMILSDGMGSGEEAARESEEVLSLLEQLLEAGFGEETAIRLLNSVLALRAEQKSFATLDISRVNLFAGTCQFIKIGGAATYLKRGSWLWKVEAKTLPIGMMQQVDYDSLVKKLYHGDMIIMLSDGVLDAVPESEREEFLRSAIGEDADQKPQLVAGRILNASLAYQGFEPLDDMTVLVCGVYGRDDL